MNAISGYMMQSLPGQRLPAGQVNMRPSMRSNNDWKKVRYV